MSLKNTNTALAEVLERDEEYAEECDAAGRRHEAASVRDRVARLKRAQAEIAALEKAAKALNEAGWLTVIPEEPRRTQSEADAAALLSTIAKEAE